MFSLSSWVKSNKLVIFLGLIIIYLLFKSSSPTSKPNLNLSRMTSESIGGSKSVSSLALPQAQAPAPATTAVTDRMVIKESNLSLLVNKVADSQKKILQKVRETGGFMVSVSLSNPQEEATSTVIVRVPVKKLDQALDYFRSLAVKIVSENLQGEDVTDQYVDLQARLNTLDKTKTKFEQLLDRATLVQDILDVQRELINVQSQIDAVKGQQQYLEKNAQMTKIIIYLSTDELSLPYAPSEAWRPQVIFKQAIRSMVGTLRSLGTLAIWMIVYAIVWIPILLIIIVLRRRKRTAL